MLDRKNSRDIYPPTGTTLNAKSWQTGMVALAAPRAAGATLIASWRH